MNRKEYTYPLRNCVWEITLACCFSCKYCGSKAGHAREHELTTEECLHIAKQLADIGCRRVSMIGGEVFMRPDWQTIVKALTSRNVKVSVITNGFLFSERILEDLKQCQIESVAVSLDGTEDVHDRYRQNGSFQRVMNAIDILTKNDIPVSVISTLHSQNVDQLETMCNILKSKNFFAWQLQACSPMGNAADRDFSTNIDFNKVIRFVAEHCRNSQFAIGVADNIGYYTESEGYIRGNTSGKAVFRGCTAGLTGIGIDSVGNVRGCESQYDEQFIEGNLRERSLFDIWNDPNAFTYNRNFTVDRLTGKCRDCEFGSKCAGGCRDGVKIFL